MSILEKIASIIFPEKCVVCSKTTNIICGGCVDSLERTVYSTSDIGSISSVFSYSDPRVRKLVWGLKYENKKSVADLLVPVMYEQVLELIQELVNYRGVKNIYIIPVPLHSNRLQERGYNQSLLLASKIFDLDTSNICILRPALLSRTKTSIPNAKTHSRKERFENTKGSFSTSSEISYAGMTILLLDDVYTTGATLTEAKNTLLRSGALDVYSIALAH